MKRILCIVGLAILPMLAMAGSRGVDLAFVDATVGERTQEGLRLAELLEKDMRSLYASETHAEVFPWNEPDLKLTVLKKSQLQLAWDRLLNGVTAHSIQERLLKLDAQDGLLVYSYDRQHRFARLKLYDSSGQECLLIRLPLEAKGSAMQHSVSRHTRHGALIALGSAVRWGP